ncbi:MAG: MoaD/ThiS family protein [Methanocorpusculum sp.]|jgi:molybdopterin converting factor small subunit|nr:MoaD/ThiS family protein [Methanocorpusculum sp.]MDD2470715.1 MoaD/ThiS family protein [Methanocorpusculum sp.]MDD4132880.1 MoaD/ThiS family protein [Methanocorpusculum sp.]
MPEIIIRSFAKFRELFGGTNSITVPPETTVSGTLLAFAKTRSASMDELFSGAELKSNIILMYNRERIDAEDAKTIIPADGDEIVIYPPVSGG